MVLICVLFVCCRVFFFFFKQKTAYEMRISDWSSDVCSSDLEIEYVFDTKAERTGISALLGRMSDLGIGYKDLKTEESSLEDIFVNLVHAPGGARSEERRVGKECVSTCRSRWSQ